MLQATFEAVVQPARLLHIRGGEGKDALLRVIAAQAAAFDPVGENRAGQLTLQDLSRRQPGLRRAVGAFAIHRQRQRGVIVKRRGVVAPQGFCGKFILFELSLVRLGRLGQPRDVALAYLFLASDEASFINGQVLSVDGGLII